MNPEDKSMQYPVIPASSTELPPIMTDAPELPSPLDTPEIKAPAQVPELPEHTETNRSTMGPVVAIVIIIITLGIAALYFWGDKLNKQEAEQQMKSQQ